MEDSIEALFAINSTVSRSVYLAVIVTTVTALAGAAVTSIDLTIRAPATLLANVDRQTLRATSEGMVERVAVALGSKVRGGDTIVSLSGETAQRALSATLAALETRQQRREDLRQLSRLTFAESPATRIPRLRLEQSRAAARAADVEWRQGSIQVTRGDKARERQARLLDKGFATPAELEAAEFELARAREERALALERRRSAWAEELASVDQQIADLERDLAARNAEHLGRLVTSPIAGTVEEIMPITAGSIVRAGDAIATISPDGFLVADALVSPKDVVFVREGMRARLIVDGYDVNEWGAADCVVVSVARDFTLADGHPVFRVRIRPTNTALHRANGTTTQLGKGLRGQVRFLLGKKRVAQLLTHRAREWFDPAAVQ